MSEPRRHKPRISRVFGVVLLLALASGTLSAISNSLQFDAQAVGSYHTKARKFNLYSHTSLDAMQKPSLGFDYVMRAGSKVRDYGYLAIQPRIAYDESEESNLQLQLYNAYVNVKLTEMDVWAGHHKTPVGLSSYLDNHALIMTDNTMSPLNFDRDWGAGVVLNRQMPSISAAITTGSGMPWYLKDNFMLSGRAGWWDMNKDNGTIGASVASGKVLHTMGYTIMHNKETHNLALVGVDAGKRILNLYGYGDLLVGTYNDKSTYLGLVRLGYNILPEDRAYMELQAVASELNNKADKYFTLGGGYKVSPYVTLRGALYLSGTDNSHMLVIQLYYLKEYTF